MRERKRTQAEQDAAYHRLAYKIELLIQKQKRKISRRVLDCGCVVLRPAVFREHGDRTEALHASMSVSTT